ncbi:MAG: DNA repair protein RadA [Brevinema sp.]
MAKSKTIFCCQSCGYETVKWLGKCPSCSEWNTFSEFSTGKSSSKQKTSLYLSKQKPEKLSEITTNISQRTFTTISEWDRVVGGSLSGQAILLSGEPGIGKSTLLLQIAQKLAKHGLIFYINGEESASQVKIRADRLSIDTDNLYLFAETDLDQILDSFNDHKPMFVIIDSLQTLTSENIDSAPGSLPQLRECTHKIVHYCKEQGICAILVSHITKDGAIAGPKAIEHLVDTVLFLESDTKGLYRVLRSFKNRFNTTDEAGFFEMKNGGLFPADNLSEAFISIHESPVFGSAIYAHSEGQRVFPIEIQVLCHQTNQNYPKRTAEGIDNSRLALLCAVIEKQLRIPLNRYDIYANITGGLEIKDRSLDCAVVAALCSSFKEIAIDYDSAFIGEVGLTGEIRPVKELEKRVKELTRLGIKKIFIPYIKNIEQDLKDFKVHPIKHINELFALLF